MRLALGNEFFGGRAPDYHQSVACVVRLEPADVLAYGLDGFELVVEGPDVGALEALDVVGVEDGLHRLDRLEKVRDRLNLFVPVQYAALDRGLIGVVRDWVPGPEDKLVELCQRSEVSDERRPPVGALAEPDGRHLADRPDGLSGAAPYVLDARDEG